MTESSAPASVVTFGQGLPGFEASREFMLLASRSLNPFALLQGTTADAPSFVGIDPRVVEPSYQPTLDRDDLARLDASADQPLVWLALVTARPDGSATVNLRAPIVINPASMRGIQLVPADSAYSLNHPLIQV